MFSEQDNDSSGSKLGRRDFIHVTSAAAVVGGIVASGAGRVVAADVAKGKFELPALPYAYDALAPVIDKETMTIHHTKHHQAYITKLNAAIAQHSELAGKTIEELLIGLDSIPESVRKAIRDNGGGHANHTLFWTVMQSPSKASKPAGQLAKAIDGKFGSLDTFKEKFSAAAAGQFGSGWAWLVLGKDGLEVVGTPNQDSPLSAGKTPLLGLDVWEHAYYLSYQNRRPDYIKSWWQLVNWDQVEKNLQKAQA
jgi:Fe-Mn family superoxide dismutase